MDDLRFADKNINEFKTQILQRNLNRDPKFYEGEGEDELDGRTDTVFESFLGEEINPDFQNDNNDFENLLFEDPGANGHKQSNNNNNQKPQQKQSQMLIEQKKSTNKFEKKTSLEMEHLATYFQNRDAIKFVKKFTPNKELYRAYCIF